jgi:DnaK suppressor protein
MAGSGGSGVMTRMATCGNQGFGIRRYLGVSDYSAVSWAQRMQNCLTRQAMADGAGGVPRCRRLGVDLSFRHGSHKIIKYEGTAFMVVRKTAAKTSVSAPRNPKKTAANSDAKAKDAAAKKAAPAKKTAVKKTAATRAAPAAGKGTTSTRATAAKKSAAAKKTGAKTVVAKKTAARAAATEASAFPAARATAEPVVPVEPEALAVRPGEDPWTREEVTQARGELLDEMERLRDEILASEKAISGLMRDSGDGAGDDQADVGTKNISREHEMSLANNAREMLRQTEHALERLEVGTYGLCESCSKPIGKARMQAFPRATLCVECKQRQERR